MGISSLLPNLKSITQKNHVSKYRGKRMAIDAYCLLHKGSYCCAREIVEGLPTDKHVAFCMSRIDLLLSNGVQPYVVFDGGRLPGKSDEENTRHRSRDENKARARQLWAAGNYTGANEAYQRSVDITTAVAKQFADALRSRGIPFIIAPYEADAQMAYLALNNLVDVVLTEDSDLLAYGCPTVFFKMDKIGYGDEINLADLIHNKTLNFIGWSHELFVEMCVMSGCDFVNSLPGIGVKKAHAALKSSRSFLRAIRALRFKGTQVPPNYEKRFQRALWTFRHQRVFCPNRRAVVHLTELPLGGLAGSAEVPGAADLEDGEPHFLGPHIEDQIAQAVAVGELDPMTHGPYKQIQMPINNNKNYGHHHHQQQQQQYRGGDGGTTATDTYNNNKREGGGGVAVFPLISTQAARQGFKRPRFVSDTSPPLTNSSGGGGSGPSSQQQQAGGRGMIASYFQKSSQQQQQQAKPVIAPNHNNHTIFNSSNCNGSNCNGQLKGTLEAAVAWQPSQVERKEPLPLDYNKNASHHQWQQPQREPSHPAPDTNILDTFLMEVKEEEKDARIGRNADGGFSNYRYGQPHHHHHQQQQQGQQQGNSPGFIQTSPAKQKGTPLYNKRRVSQAVDTDERRLMRNLPPGDNHCNLLPLLGVGGAGVGVGNAAILDGDMRALLRDTLRVLPGAKKPVPPSRHLYYNAENENAYINTIGGGGGDDICINGGDDGNDDDAGVASACHRPDNPMADLSHLAQYKQTAQVVIGQALERATAVAAEYQLPELPVDSSNHLEKKKMKMQQKLEQEVEQRQRESKKRPLFSNFTFRK